MKALSPRTIGRTLLALALGIGILAASRGITNEGAVSTQGDMPRYMMNGVFLYDFVARGGCWTFTGCLDYATLYFAKYPALTLGHHPPLLSISLVPFYATFGVSVFSSRLAVIGFFLWATWLVYLIGRRQYGPEVGGWASLLFATTPSIVPFGQVVLSEVPSVATVLLALSLLLRFAESGRTWDYVFFVAAAIASLAAKQLAVFMFPVYFAVLATGGRWRLLLRRGILTMTAIGVTCVVIAGLVTLVYSPVNANLVLWLLTQWQGWPWAWTILERILTEQLTVSLGICLVLAWMAAVVRRDARIALSLVWLIVVLTCTIVVVGAVDPMRYSLLVIPAYALSAASLAAQVKTPRWRFGVALLLGCTVVAHVWQLLHIRPMGAGGYEAAAKYVVEHGGGPTVLFSGAVDTGYFVFFVRKHDPSGSMMVLRSDKLLTTSFMGNPANEDHITGPTEIYPPLDRYGTRFVVIEDRPTESVVLNWLRDELKTGRFQERVRFPIESGDRRLRNVSLAVYEYKDARPADPNAKVLLRLPMAGREISATLSEIVDVPTSQ